MRLPSGLLGLLVVTVLAACGQPAAPALTPGTAPPTPSASPSAAGPVITAFQVIDEISCTGAQASVPISWATRNAQEVKFQVDNSLLTAGYPTSGTGTIQVPCDGREHSVVLQATGAGGQAAIARHVNTSNSPPPSTAPSITAFDLLEDVTCTGSTVEVAAGWSTTNAQAVNFSVDGQPLPAGAGFPVTGAGNVQVPCDGKSHKVTLTATGTGAPASLSRSVNTSNTPTPPPVSGPVITAFTLIDDVTCSGAQASVPASWTTQGAQAVSFSVDGQPVSAGAGYPVSGVGKVPVPCDGREHLVLLVASGPGGQANLARQVNTANTPPPPTAPSITRFDVLDDVTCSGTTVEVSAAWVTQNTQAVNFSVDGQPLPAAAGFPVTGVGRIPVPCDGAAHKVTLTATGTGAPAALSRSVNTTVAAPSSPTTTVPAPLTTTTGG
jgi:hypothetical protein